VRGTTVIFLSLVLHAGGAAADTFGYPVCSKLNGQFSSERARGETRGVVARTQAQYEQLVAPNEVAKLARVDFTRDMVVGVVSEPGHERVVYRVELDDAANPSALVVRLASPNAPCKGGRTPARARTHLVIVPRSGLAVRFVIDDMIDGRVFNERNEGVDSKVLTIVPAPESAASNGKAPNREDAERAAVAALTAAERERLAMGPRGGKMQRVPHSWTNTVISRDEKVWHVSYDDVSLDVDVATGNVTRR
jgi:hypothetical protein